MKHYLTPEQEKFFDQCVIKWQRNLGLQNWRIERSPKTAKIAAMASVKVSMADRLAVYRTGNWGEPPTPETIESTAVHELLHIMLAAYKLALLAAPDNDELVMSAEHGVVVLLERLLMGQA